MGSLSLSDADRRRLPPGLWEKYLGDPGHWGRAVLAAAGRLPRPAARADVPVLDEWAYITLPRLLADAESLCDRLPPALDAVVGISRSGLAPASALAYRLHLPLLAVSRQTGLTLPGHGFRLDDRPVVAPRHVLLIDDTAASGREMKACLEIVRRELPWAEVTRAVVYCHPKGLHAVDLYAAVYPGSHYLDWNWPNAGHGASCAYDFDGILCPDFTPAECLDMETYRAAMAAKPTRYLPRRTVVPLIATGRPEACRDVTEAWLTRWGVRWDRLVMWPGEPHPAAADVAPWKAAHYAGSDCALFAESDPEQATIIHRITGRTVLCPALGRVLPGRDLLADPGRAGAGLAARLELVASCDYRSGPVEDGGCGCLHHCGRGGGLPMTPNLVSMGQCLACVGTEASRGKAG